MLQIFKNKPFVLTLASKSAVGKTSLAIALLDKIMSPTDRLYFITNDSERSIMRKIGLLRNPIHGAVFSVQSHEKLERTVDEAIDRKIEYVVLDSLEYQYDNETKQKFILLVNKLYANRINVIIVSQLYNNVATNPATEDVKLHHIVRLSTFVAILTHKTLTKWQRFLSKLTFWELPPNRTLKLVKNRYGAEMTKDFNIDFVTLKTNL